MTCWWEQLRSFAQQSRHQLQIDGFPDGAIKVRLTIIDPRAPAARKLPTVTEYYHPEQIADPAVMARDVGFQIARLNEIAEHA